MTPRFCIPAVAPRETGAMQRLSIFVGLAALVAGALLLPGCTVQRSFHGPGFERGRGVTLPAAGETVFMSLTHGVLDRSTRKAFDSYIEKVVEDLPNHAGLVGLSVRKELLGDEVWTMTVWADRQSFRDYVRSPVHQAAMDAGAPAVEEFRSALIEVPANSIPVGWRDALDLLDAEQPREPGR